MKQILIIGAGFAGLWSALSAIRQLDLNGSKGVEVTLLAPQAELHVRPRFYEPDAHTLAAPCRRCSTLSMSVSCRARHTTSMKRPAAWAIAPAAALAAPCPMTA